MTWTILAIIAVLGVNNCICFALGALGYRLGRVESAKSPANDSVSPAVIPEIIDRERQQERRKRTEAEAESAELEKAFKSYEEVLFT